jgi:predicted neuraminidase
VFIFERAPFASCHASTIVELAPDRFVAAWFGGTREGANDVKIWWSRFDGTRWSPPAVAAEEPGFPCWNPVLFKTDRKTVLLFYKAGRDPISWTGYVRRSSDNARTWGTPEQLPAGLLGPIKNKPIQPMRGVLLSGTSVESHRAWTSWVERSTDDGRTWRRFGPIVVPGHPHGNIQPVLFALSERNILALCRTRGVGSIVQATSSDGGESWSPARPIDLPNPNSGFDGVRTSGGALYLVYNHTRTGRSPLNLARSTDNGLSWRPALTLEEERGEFSYPAIIEGWDRRLHITYTWNRRHIKYRAIDPAALNR